MAGAAGGHWLFASLKDPEALPDAVVP